MCHRAFEKFYHIERSVFFENGMSCQPDNLCVRNADNFFSSSCPSEDGEIDLCSPESSDTEDSDE